MNKKLEKFTTDNKFKGKSPLCVALVVTQHARKMGFPLDPSKLITGGKGQVLGLGKSAVQTLLKKHSIERVLAAEGGRTSRGSLGNMEAYVDFLNQEAASGDIDLDEIEKFWIQKVREFFAGKPFKIRMDASMSLRTVIMGVLAQAEERQKEATGTHYAGAVIQHLVGAKLECAIGEGQFDHNSFSTSDQQSGRAGDFQICDVAIHVTTSPGEAVIQRCGDNIHDDLKPVLVTTQRGTAIAEGLAENASLADRIDIFEITQFVALNIYELGKFAPDGRKTAVTDIIDKYNEIVDQWETDPSLRIEFRK